MLFAYSWHSRFIRIRRILDRHKCFQDRFQFISTCYYSKILLPVIHTAQTLQKIIFTADLARATGADINILALNTSGLKSVQRLVDSNVAKAEKYLDEKGVNYFVERINSKNLAGDIIDHARLVDADLIAIMTDVQDQANSILLGPFAQQLVSHSPVPVLSMHPKDHITL
jgi:nucleotide-binding universal stress UspA family protein